MEKIITDKNGHLIRASKIEEITAENEQTRYCTAHLENGKKISLPMSLKKAMKYLKYICNQKTIG